MQRLMRLRSNRHLRDLCAETTFSRAQLIQPLFVVEGLAQDEPIAGLPGNRRLPLESALYQVASDLEAGVTQFLLFPVPGKKKADAFEHDFAQAVIGGLKARFGQDFCLWVDTCLCSSTTTGHCAVLSDGRIELDRTLEELARAALAFAQAGADGVAPSDMMDGRVAALRHNLDEQGYTLTPVMSYSTKFASNFYGPFRQAADSAPQFGDRRHYQIDPRMRSDALAASARCAAEGADLLMVKPGLTSLDLLRPIHKHTGQPVGAYQVSGEYAALALLAEQGLTNFDAALLETWHVFKRAGAQFVISYGARHAKRLGIGE